MKRLLLGSFGLLLALVLIAGAPLTAAPLREANPPTVVSVSPNVGYNFRSTPVTVLGTGILATPDVLLNNVPLEDVTWVSSTTVTARVPADLPAGIYTLSLTNPDGQHTSVASAFTVLASGDGNLSPWRNTGAMAVPRLGLAVVSAGDRIYALGGGVGWGDQPNTVESAAVIADGVLSSWQPASSMVIPRNFLAAVVAYDCIYALGGRNDSGHLSSVERARVAPDGSLGAWETVGNMTLPRSELAAVVAGGYLYALGGANASTGSTRLDSVERAQLQTDGSLGPWQVAGFMTVGRTGLASVAMGGYIYALGGHDGRSDLDSVERAPVYADGSLGSWAQTTSMSLPRSLLAAVAMRGAIYVMGGYSNQRAPYHHVSVERASVNPYGAGALGPWEQVQELKVGRIALGAVAVRNSVYAMGGLRREPQATLSSVEWSVVSVPRLSNVVPQTVSSLQPRTVSIAGTNLLPNPTLRLGGFMDLPSAFVSPTTITATVPAGLPIGSYSVALTNGDGQTANLDDALRVVVSPLGVTISGTAETVVDTACTFVAVVSPPDVTPPITYTWSAAPSSGQGTAAAHYAWSVPGEKTITVTLENAGGMASASHVVSVLVPPTGVTIDGPTSGFVNTACVLRATVSPPTVSLPLDYSWSPEPTSGQGASEVRYIWTTDGPQTVSVTVLNAVGTAVATHHIDITRVQVCLPLILH